MDYSYQKDNIYQILEAIINEQPYDGGSSSVIADILISILESTPYTGESPKSVIGQLLLRLKDKLEGNDPEPYEDTEVSNIAKILISIINETEYTDPPRSNIAELLLELKDKLETLVEITVTGNPVTFTTNVSKPLKACSVNIPVTQEGTGDPSPNNIRNFVGISSLDFTANSAVKTFTFGQTVYGGELNVLTGIFTVNTFFFKPKSILNMDKSGNTTFFRIRISKTGIGGNKGGKVFCNVLKQNQNQYSLNSCRITPTGVVLQIVIDQAITTVEGAKQWLIDNDCTFVYELDTPEEINLGGMNIITNIGENNLLSNIGDISATYFYKNTDE